MSGKQLQKLPTTPPKYLTSYAARIWRKIVPYLISTEVVKTPDQTMVEAFCINYQILRQSYEAIKSDGIQTKLYKSLQNSAGEIVGKDFVGYKANPALKSIESASVKINSLGSQLGLSPAARAELNELGSGDDEDLNVEEVLNGGEDDF